MKKIIIAIGLTLLSIHSKAQTATGQSNIKNGLQVQYTIEETQSADDEATVNLVLRQNNRIIANKTYKQPTYNLTVTEASLLNNKGLNGIQNIIRISHNADADEIPIDTYYWAWNGERLIVLPSTEEFYIVDQGSISTKLIFPSDKGGIANTIRRIETAVDPDTKKTHKTEKRFTWQGKDINSKN